MKLKKTSKQIEVAFKGKNSEKIIFRTDTEGAIGNFSIHIEKENSSLEKIFFQDENHKNTIEKIFSSSSYINVEKEFNEEGNQLLEISYRSNSSWISAMKRYIIVECTDKIGLRIRIKDDFLIPKFVNFYVNQNYLDCIKGLKYWFEKDGGNVPHYIVKIISKYKNNNIEVIIPWDILSQN